MTRRAFPRARRTASAALAAALLLGGCASTDIDKNFQGVQSLTRNRLGAEVKWLNTDEARRQAQADVDATLAKPRAPAAQPVAASGAVRQCGRLGEIGRAAGRERV